MKRIDIHDAGDGSRVECDGIEYGRLVVHCALPPQEVASALKRVLVAMVNPRLRDPEYREAFLAQISKIE